MINTANFKLFLFGGFKLMDREGNPVDSGPRKVKALLGWLAVNPDIEHPREKISAMFWPDAEEEGARHSLRQALAHLRKVMPEAISPLHTSREFIRLDSSRIEVDVRDFEAALSRGEVRERAEITRLYQGEFLAGCNPRSDLFDDWLDEHRHYYRERAINAMCQHLTALIDTRQFAQATPVAMKLINIDPLRESAYRGLMMAYLALGNYALALRWYRRCERVLLRELNVLPCLETRALHAQILAKWDNAKSDSQVQSPSLKSRKQAGRIVSKANQRIMYQLESAIEGIFDHQGGQSVLLRSDSAEAKTRLAEQIIALAESQGFQACRGEISDVSEQGRSPQQALACSHISNCLDLATFAQPDAPKQLEGKLAEQLEECVAAIKVASENSPLLLILENIHLAGNRTLKLLARLISSVGEASVLLVMTSNFGGESREQAWQGAMVNAPLTTVDLA